jgi:hypothetical protein
MPSNWTPHWFPQSPPKSNFENCKNKNSLCNATIVNSALFKDWMSELDTAWIQLGT